MFSCFRRLRGSSDLGTICLTVQDYYNDYIHLRPHIRLTLIREIAFKLIGEYVRAIGNRWVLVVCVEVEYFADV